LLAGVGGYTHALLTARGTLGSTFFWHHLRYGSFPALQWVYSKYPGSLSMHCRRFFIRQLAFLLLLSVIGAKPSIAGQPPNIIFILTDDQGYGDISAHGNPVLKTPNLDRLHAQGVRFTNFHVSPTCAPTRSALMTGRHEFKNGVTHTILERERMALSSTTIAQLLQSVGYKTGIFGKWHLGDEPEYQPQNRGFDEVFIHGGGGIGQTYPGSCGDAPNNKYFDPAILHNGTFVKTTGYCTDVFFEQALQWIDTQTNAKQPFFAYIATNAPHGPLIARDEDKAVFKGMGLPEDVQSFYGMIHNIDQNIGTLIDRIDQQGIADNTLVIFMNDNGGTAGVKLFNADMRGSKGSPWIGGTRAASFWRWPGTLHPADCDALAAHVDFFPTLAEIVGAKLNDQTSQQVEGRSLFPLLQNPATPCADRYLISHVGRWPKGADPNEWKYKKASIRNDRWALVSDTGGSAPQWQLFDLSTDYGQAKDVQSQYPNVVAELQAAFDVWWSDSLPLMVNEQAVGPKINPFHAIYYKQFGGAPATDSSDQAKANRGNALPQSRPVADTSESPISSSPQYDPSVLPAGHEYFTLRNGLDNSRLKFRREKRGRIAFLGGSITASTGWRDHVMEYFKQRFPETDFDFVNAGISSLGSVPHAFRLRQDIIDRGSVDLLFVEAAVNDSTNTRNPTHMLRAMEGLVRQMRLLNPLIDIVHLHFVMPEHIEDYKQGRAPVSIEQHEKVATAYGNASLNLALEVKERIGAGEFSWEGDFKNLHPAPFGHQLYANSIARMIEAALKNPLRESVSPHALPAFPLDSQSYDRGRFGSIRDVKIIRGFRIDESWQPTDGKGTRAGFVNVPALIGTDSGAEFEFVFEGTAAGLFITSGPDSGDIEYKIDSVEYRLLSPFTQWSPGLHLPWALILDDELAAGLHTVRVRIADSSDGKSTGTALRVFHLLLN